MCSQQNQPLEKMSVGNFLATLNIAQLWKLIGVGAALIGGAFALGYSISSWVSQGEISSTKQDLAELQSEHNSLQQNYDDLQDEKAKLEIKENVLRVFHFYNEAKYLVLLPTLKVDDFERRHCRLPGDHFSTFNN